MLDGGLPCFQGYLPIKCGVSSWPPTIFVTKRCGDILDLFQVEILPLCSNSFCMWSWSGFWVPKHLLTAYLEHSGTSPCLQHLFGIILEIIRFLYCSPFSKNVFWMTIIDFKQTDPTSARFNQGIVGCTPTNVLLWKKALYSVSIYWWKTSPSRIPRQHQNKIPWVYIGSLKKSGHIFTIYLDRKKPLDFWSLLIDIGHPKTMIYKEKHVIWQPF